MSYPVLLGPLPAAEAAFFLGAHPALSRMVFGAEAGEKSLALRLLNASRFHPLLLDRLARLAVEPVLRPQLLQALDTLEKTKDFSQLPALFATSPGDANPRPRTPRPLPARSSARSTSPGKPILEQQGSDVQNSKLAAERVPIIKWPPRQF